MPKKTLHKLFKFSTSMSYEKFVTATQKVAETQKSILIDILKKNTYTEIGFEHNFKDITTFKQFRSDVPLSTFKNYIPYLKAVFNGKDSVLTHESIAAFIPAKGKKNKSKYIPQTSEFRKYVRNAINPWIHQLYLLDKNFMKGTFYWALSPRTEKEDTKEIPIGYDNDDQFLNPFQQQIFRMIQSVPQEVAQIDDIENFRYVTLLFLLRNNDLTFFSIKHPKFLLFLIEEINPLQDAILADMKTGTISTLTPMRIGLKKRLMKKWKRHPHRAAKLKQLFDKWFDKKTAPEDNTSLYEEIWPNLKLITCWGDADASIYIPEIRRYFPNVLIQPKGLQTVEALVSFPINKKNETVLAICSHFFEFIDINDKENKSTHLAHQLEKGKSYSVAITTHGGLYRYQLEDIIEVTGFMNQCPIITFIAKENRLVDLFGEKLYDDHVTDIFDFIAHKYRIRPSFMMLAPSLDAPKKLHFYTLFICLDDPNVLTPARWQNFLTDMQQKLRTNAHYRNCVEQEQLLPLKIFLIDAGVPARAQYVRFIKEENPKVTEVRVPAVDKHTNFMDVFQGRLIAG